MVPYIKHKTCIEERKRKREKERECYRKHVSKIIHPVNSKTNPR